MKKSLLRILSALSFGCLFLSATPASAQSVPGLLNYQGRVAVGGVNFDGTGQFKFALVNGDGSFTHWSNDGTFGSEPAAAVSIPVVKGLYSVLLGDTSLTNMQPIFPSVFENDDVRLRVWFNDGTHGFQQLTPDQRIAAVGYAMMAQTVPNGSISGGKLMLGAVYGVHIQPGAVEGLHLAPGAVQAGNLASGAVTRDSIADGAVNGAKIGAGAVGALQIASASIGGESWIPTANPFDGPVGRVGHSVVWTGTEFIIWGGLADVFGGPAVSNTGARYNPATDTWTNITLTGAPAARRGHTAVWTGTEMIVWGGTAAIDGESGGLNSGGRYNPATDTWTNTGGGFGVPPGRRNHSAVWTGSGMIVWGGLDAGGNFLGDGSKLDGPTNFWSAISSDDAPEVRHSHSAIWTGSKMVVWGGVGVSGPTNTGNFYDEALDVWASTPMPLSGAPDGRSGHSVIWTGTDMIVWGGEGADAQPVTGGTSTQRANGGRYRVATNSWHPMTVAGAPAHRTDHTAVWTGHEMLVWGGTSSTDLGGGSSVAGSLDDGAVYEPETDSWRPMIQAGAPAARTGHTAAWTGREMVVWGGTSQGNLLNTGGRYRLSLIANGAVGARQLAAGAVGSQQLASGAVQSSNIADGAVGSAQLGDYSVTATHLSLGYRSGGLSDGPVTLGPDGFFRYSASFAPPFVAPSNPTVTMASDEWEIVTSSRNGFSARAPAEFTPVVAAALPTDATYSVAGIVQGFPAVAYRDPASGDVCFVRATNAEGTAWGTPLVIGSGATFVSSLAMIAGRPAVLFTTSTGLNFVRASDATGSGWAAPSVANGGSVHANPILTEIGGNPGVAYMTGSISFGAFVGDGVHFIRSSNPEGTSWSAPTLVATPAPGTDFVSIGLVEAAGHPAIAFTQSGRSNQTVQTLFYKRADNGEGSSWSTTASGMSLGDYGVVAGRFIPHRRVSMAIIEGHPAILTVRQEGGTRDALIYLRSATPEGGSLDSWEYGVSLTGGLNNTLSTGQLVTIAGHPTVTFGGEGGGYLRLKTATGIGISASATDVVQTFASNLLDIGGMPVGISADSSGIVVSRLNAAAAPSADWQASDGTVVPLIAATVQAGAIGSTQLANGAVGSPQLATGAVQGTNIADGAIGSGQIAAGAIDFHALSKPPQAGSIGQNEIDLQFGRGEFEVVFPQAYSASPIVTVSVSSTDEPLAGALVGIASTTSTGFTGRIQTAAATPVVLAEDSGASFAFASNYLVFRSDAGLKSKFVNTFSADAPSNSTTIDSGASFHAVSAVVTPLGAAVAYYDSFNKDLKFAHEFYAAAGNGVWDVPIVIESAGDVGADLSLSLVGGHPAIAYYDKTNQTLKYRISSDYGDTWSPPVVVAGAGNEGVECALLEVDGAPTIAYCRRDDDILRFVRANDAAGTAWLAPVVVDGLVGDGSGDCSLAVVNGQPAISCYLGGNDSIGYYRALDTSGNSWGGRLIVASAGVFSGSTSLKMVDGKPAIAFHVLNSPGPDSVQFVWASDGDGTAWNAPVILKTGTSAGVGTQMRVDGNEVGIAYYHSLNGRIEAMRHSLTPVSFSINWIALPQ